MAPNLPSQLTTSSAALVRLMPSLPAASCAWHTHGGASGLARETCAGLHEIRPPPRRALRTAPPEAPPEPALGVRSRRSAGLGTAGATAGQAASAGAQQVAHQEALLGSLFDAQLGQYLQTNPTSSRCLDLVQHWEHGAPLTFDHLAFRTFGADGYGIDSIGALLEAFGYTRRDFLAFPQKKLRAFWFSPPPYPSVPPAPSGGRGEHIGGAAPSLPRVFVSELAVEELSAEAQAIIHGYTAEARSAAPHAFALSPLCPRPWRVPSSRHFQTLARESEYAAWTLVNGYSLNHTTISVHHLGSLTPEGGDTPAAELASAPLHALNRRLESKRIKLNQQGGTVKVSPDGLLLQSSTVADSAPFDFSDGSTLPVPVSYVEFALRLVLPQFAHLPPSQVEEQHRRDGFEVGNADKIFESTSSTQAS